MIGRTGLAQGTWDSGHLMNLWGIDYCFNFLVNSFLIRFQRDK